MTVFQPLFVEVKSVGEDVTLAIGSWNRTLHFETAILFASWMDECARSAKRWTGNTQHRLRAYGTLHDASNPRWLNEGQPFDPLRVYPVNRDLLKKEQIEVKQEQGLVVITASTTRIAIPYDAAIQVSQWVRARAKESQMRAGDNRHWSKIKQEHDDKAGPGVTRG